MSLSLICVVLPGLQAAWLRPADVQPAVDSPLVVSEVCWGGSAAASDTDRPNELHPSITDNPDQPDMMNGY